jgi:hypothetical protein
MSDLETVEIYSSRTEAELAKGYLENMGIDTRIMADDADQLYPSLGLVRGVRLLARQEDVEKAKAFLKDRK